MFDCMGVSEFTEQLRHYHSWVACMTQRCHTSDGTSWHEWDPLDDVRRAEDNGNLWTISQCTDILSPKSKGRCLAVEEPSNLGWRPFYGLDSRPLSLSPLRRHLWHSFAAFNCEQGGKQKWMPGSVAALIPSCLVAKPRAKTRAMLCLTLPLGIPSRVGMEFCPEMVGIARLDLFCNGMDRNCKSLESLLELDPVQTLQETIR